MPKSWSSREVIVALEAAGWQVARQRGSHVQLVSPDGARHATVPHPSADLKPGTLSALRRQTGLALR